MQNSPLPERPPPASIVKIGRWRVDPRADEIEAEGRVVKLEPLKMRLLMALAERPGEVLLTQELLDTVWRGLIVTSSSVYQGIAQLRRQLGDEHEQTYIETVPRKGYRLVAPVQRLARPAAESPGEPAASKAVAPAAWAPNVPALPPATGPVDAANGPSWPVQRRWLIGAAAAGVAGLAAWRFVDSRPPPLPVRIAVLPFVDRTQGAVAQALSQGLALDVIRVLERHPQVDVVAPESVLVLGNLAPRIGEVVRRLQVGFVLIGEVVRANARVQVVMRLLSLPSERERWRGEFDQAMDGLSLLPQVIATQATAALHLRPAPLVGHAAGPSEAYELYILGEHAWRPKTQEAFIKARGYFERGIEIDPAYARNYVGAGWTWLGQSNYGAGLDWNEAFARATPLFDKALRLDPDLSEVITAQGVLQTQMTHYDEARVLFARAVELAPGYAQAHHSYGVAEYDDGWPQRAIPHFQRAAELNPLSLAPHERLGLAYVTSGRFPEAELAYQRAIALEPKHPNGHWGQATSRYAQGALDAAVAHYRAALQLEPRRPFLWDQLGWLYLDLGLPDLAADAFGRTGALLPTSRWPAIHAANAWLIRPAERGAPPPELALSKQQVPEDGFAIDVMVLRAMANLPVDDALLQRALDAMGSVRTPLQPLLWFVFQGHHWLLDLSSVYLAMGQPERALPYLDLVAQQLDRYERQGNVWHALHFHRARLLALRGDRDGAVTSLEAAAKAGCRRAWRLRLDPAFAAVRDQPRCIAVLAHIDAETKRQRALLAP